MMHSSRFAAILGLFFFAACRKTVESTANPQASASHGTPGSELSPSPGIPLSETRSSGNAGPPSEGQTRSTSTDGTPYSCGWTGAIRYVGKTLHVGPSGRDTNSGESESQAFGTLQKAADEAAPGDTVLVHGGTYSGTGEAVLRIHRSGSPDAPIRFLAATGPRPRIESNAWHAIQIDEASYVTVQGFELIGRAASTPMEFAKAHASDPKEAVTNGDGFHIWNYRTGGRSHHIIVQDNVVHHFGASGIFLAQFDCVSLLGNRVYSNSWHTVYGTSGINVWKPQDLVAHDGYKLVVHGNRVFDNENLIPWIDAKPVPKIEDGGNGIVVDLTTPYKYGGRTLIANNLAYRNGGVGIYAFAAEHVDVVNNVGYHNGRGRAVDLGEIAARKSKDIHFRNNILVASPGMKINTNTDNEGVSYDYNIYFGGGAIEAKGPHDREADPKFLAVSGGEVRDRVGERGWDFRLAPASPAMDSGIAFATVAVDIDGQHRPHGGGVDLGAYER